jgi:hypothetical protein
MSVEIDHLVVAAATLDAGVRWCESTLGVVPGPGGRHPLMGTHNRLLALGSAAFPRSYLEIVAIDPDAPAPGRVRWFGLDEPAVQRRLHEQGPALRHLVVRTRTLDRHRDGLIQRGFDPGATLRAERETPSGTLRWRIVVRDDGRLPLEGVLPTLIEWDGPHPADTMPPSGLSLQALRLDGLPAAAADVLGLHAVAGDPAAPPALAAVLDTPLGKRPLTS